MRYIVLAKRRGFTLIELIIVVAIIGLLSAIILFSVQQARESARDRQRMADLRQMELALELYKEAHGEYPKPTPSCGTDFSKWYGFIENYGNWAGWYVQCDKAAGETWAEGLVPTFIAELPTNPQPQTWGPVGYQYRVSADGSSYKLRIYFGFESDRINSFQDEFGRCPASCGNTGHCALTHGDFSRSPTVWGGPASACW